MSSLESFDGLCGIIAIGASSEKQVRCKYEFGHEGPHSYEGTAAKPGCVSFLGVFVHPVEEYTQKK